MASRAGILIVLLAVSACATTPRAVTPVQLGVGDRPFGDPARRDRQASLVMDAITDTHDGALLTPAELAARLSGTQLVFVGESHTHLDSHIAQARLIEALVVAGRHVSVALEMFPRDDATDRTLHAWTDGVVDEDTFVRTSRWYHHWGFPFAYYRDVFTAARRHHVRLFGVNAPRGVISAVRTKGFAGLSDDEKAHLPPRVDTTNEEHRRLFRAFFGDADATHGAHLPDDAWEGMFRAQCTWDAVMAWNALRLLRDDAAARPIVVVLLGTGHVAFGLGATRQAIAAGATGVASVITVPVIDDEGQTTQARASYADYLWTIPPEPELPLFPTLGVSLDSADRPDQQGATIKKVASESAAARAGVKTNDRLVALDDTPVSDQETLSRLMAAKHWGDAVRMTIQRAGQQKALTLVAVLRRAPPASASTNTEPTRAPASSVR